MSLFEDSDSYVDRAKHHIQDLQARIDLFEKGEPYKRATEYDSNDPNTILHQIKMVSSVDPTLSNIAFDVVNNLRAALDVAGYSIAFKTRSRNKNTNFPFAQDLTHFKTNAPGRCKDLPQDIQNLLLGFKGDKGGNDLLWALNEMCNSNKHMSLIRAKPAVVHEERILRVATTGRWEFIKDLVLDTAKNEVLIAWSTVDSDFKCHYKVTFDVV